MGSILYTIGYAGFPDIGEFIGELKKNGITTLIDIRRRPYQAYYEQYEENTLRNALTREDLAYIKFYDDFGMSTDDSEEGPESPLDFEKVSGSEGFSKGISRLVFGMEKDLVPVIMGEAMDPVMCPRGLLIARALSNMGYTVRHILPGVIKDHKEIEESIKEFAKADLSAQQAGTYQMSLIPSEKTASDLLSDEALLSEGYRRLNRMLF